MFEMILLLSGYYIFLGMCIGVVLLILHVQHKPFTYWKTLSIFIVVPFIFAASLVLMYR